LEIKILSYLACSDLLASHPKEWSVVVILDSDRTLSSFVEDKSIDFLKLKFDDIKRPRYGKMEPRIEDMTAALDFSRSRDQIIVCCRAGQSRSAALGFVLAYGKTGDEAIGIWDPTKHKPNTKVLELAAEATGDARILELYDSWCKANKGTELSDYLDERICEIEQLESRGIEDWITEK